MVLFIIDTSSLLSYWNERFIANVGTYAQYLCIVFLYLNNMFVAYVQLYYESWINCIDLNIEIFIIL